jgi:hypothetical protein
LLYNFTQAQSAITRTCESYIVRYGSTEILQSKNHEGFFTEMLSAQRNAFQQYYRALREGSISFYELHGILRSDCAESSGFSGINRDAQTAPHVIGLSDINNNLSKSEEGDRSSYPAAPIQRRFFTAAIALICVGAVGIYNLSRFRFWFWLNCLSVSLFAASLALYYLTIFRWSWGGWW